MFKRKLFKRALSKHVLPVILSVAMVFQSMPATASAAEQTTEAGTEAESTDVADAADEAAESAGEAEYSEAGSAPTQETVSAEDAGQSEAESSAETETQPGTGISVETETQPGTTGTYVEPSDSDTAEKSDKSENQQETTVEDLQEAAGEAAGLETVIKIREPYLYGFTRSQSESDSYLFTTEYSEQSKFGNVKSSVRNAVTVEVDGEEKPFLKDDLYLGMQFQSGEEKDGAVTYTDMDGLPTEAGKYCLKISVKAVPELCGDAADKFVYFEIKKCTLKLDLRNLTDNIKPGTSISDFKKTVIENYAIENDYDGRMKSLTRIDAADIKVYETGNDGKVAETETTDTAFSNDKTYVAAVGVKFKDETVTGANYTIATEKYYVLTVGQLVRPEVSVSLRKPVDVRTYEKGKKLVIDDITKEYIDVGSLKVTKTENGAEVSVFDDGVNVGDIVKPAWYTREQTKNVTMPELDDETQFEADDYRYTVLEGEPEDAGAYYIVYVYPGEAGKYKKAYSNAVQVSVDPAPLMIAPAGIELTAGMDADAVEKALAKAGYTLYNVNADGSKGSEYKPDSENFFGVFYSDAEEDKEKSQQYAPEFKLQQRVELDKDQQTETDKWGAWESYDGKKLTNGTDSKAVQYQVVPTGYKVVRDADGSIGRREPLTDTTTNSAEQNYSIVSKEAFPVTLKEAVPTAINTDAIVKAFKDKGGKGGNGTSPDDVLWTIYDEDLLFASREEYKQAQVEGANVGKADESITYTWQIAGKYAYDRYITTDPAEDEGKAKQDAEAALLESFTPVTNQTYDGFFVSPRDAALYRLHIEYKDAANEKQPSEGDVYFQIKPRAVITAADRQYAAYGDTIRTTETGYYSIWMLDENNDETKLEAAVQIPVSTDSIGARKITERLDKTSDTWVRATEQTFMKDESYRISYVFDDKTGTMAGSLKWDNFTNRKAYDFENASWTYYALPGDVSFNSSELEITVNAEAPSSAVYNAEPAFKEMPAGFVTINNKETGEAVELPVNTNAANAVMLYWKWQNWNPNDGNNKVAFTDAVYGGTYQLYVSFAGDENYKAIADQPVKKADGTDYVFRINKRDISLTPVLNEDVKAGELAGTLINPNEILYDGVPAADAEAFRYGALGSTRYDWAKNQPAYYIGYRAFESNGAKTETIGGEQVSVSDCGVSSVVYRDDKPVNSKRDYLRAEKEYAVKLNSGLAFPYDASYNVTWKTSVKKITERGTAEVYPVGFLGKVSGDEEAVSVDIHWTKDENGTYVITPREGIPFAYKGYYNDLWADGETIPMDKNYIAIQIRVPREFLGDINGSEFSSNKKQFIYENSIKAANGYVLSGPEISYGKQAYGYINVLFPVALNSDGKAGVPDKDGKVTTAPQFYITWESGCTETFKLDLEKAQLESNLRNAVSPKSLAFNGVQTKMAVGEEQQLDVKITKQQLGDIVRIQYRLADENQKNIISIDEETGRVTALRAEKASVTIEAYPVRLADDGKTFEEIPQGKGVVKPAKTKITVTEVTAPAVKNIQVLDNASARVSYTVPDNGYRREIYVVETDKNSVKLWTAQKFDKAIDDMKNGQWEGTFATAPVYVSNEKAYTAANGWTADEDYYYDTAKKLFSRRIDGLETAGGTYVVYVRNVSAERTLEDGSTVAFSKAGTVKNFVTTLAKIQDIVPKFTVTETENDKKNPVKYYDVDDEGYIVPSSTMKYVDKTVELNIDIPDRQIPIYLADLFAKSAQVSADGWFYEKPGNQSADADDYIKSELPLKKSNADMLKQYVDPKVTYAVTDTDRQPKFENNKWDLTNQSKFASISGSGKITFKGVDVNGVAAVYVWALADNGAANRCKLYIVAMPDTVTGKKAKMKVGDQIRLAALLDYKAGKTKIPSYRSVDIEITSTAAEIEKAGFELREAYRDEVVNGEKCAAGEWIITAKTPTPTRDFQLKLKDWSLAARDAQDAPEAVVTLTAAQLDPVKSLKAVYVDDKHITLNFAHAGSPEAFDIEVRDARGGIVYKKLARNDQNVWRVGKNRADYIQRYQKGIIRGSQLAYFEKTKSYAITIDTDRLIRLSAYTITVTPVYEGQRAAKPATAKTKTTNIPASYADADLEENGRGGADIFYSDAYWTETALVDSPYFTSGNTYTLFIQTNTNAKDRVTDTLTWKSSNTKVASVKANPGSYTATLKPVQQGVTTISVTSKITKKVIARWDVKVKAVGNGKDYGGDYEWAANDSFYKDILAKWDPFYEGKLEMLTLNTPVTTTNHDRTWVSFTAPVFGEYQFYCSTGYRAFGSRNLETEDENNSSGRKRYKLEADQKIYFCVQGEGTLRVSGYTDFTRITTANNKENALNVPKESWIAFTAPEENCYTFEGTAVSSTYIKENVEYTDWYSHEISLKAGETIFIKAYSGTLYVTYRKADVELTLEEPSSEVTFRADAKTQYVRFTAPVSQDYTFEVPDDLTVNYYKASGEDLSGTDFVTMSKAEDDGTTPAEPAAPKTQKKTLYLEAGTTIIIELSVDVIPSGQNEHKAIVKVTASAVKELVTEESVTKDTKATLAFRIPETPNARYTFSATQGASLTYYNSEGTALGYIINDTLTITNGKVSVNGLAIKAGDSIYIKVDASGAAEDVKVSVSALDGNAVLETGTSEKLTLNNDFADRWYTFEARTAGWYAFGAKAEANTDKETHMLTVKRVNAVFENYYSYSDGITISSGGSEASQLVALKAGDKVVLKVSANDVSDKDITTAAGFYVNKVDVKPINLGGTDVSLSAKGSRNYYVFTATEYDYHTFVWEPAKDTGAADAKYGMEMASMSTLSSDQQYMRVGDSYYFSVEQTTDTAVSGILRVRSGKSGEKVLSSGSNSFELKDGETVSYKFTVPADNVLGYKLTVVNNAEENENEEKPRVAIFGRYVEAGDSWCFEQSSWTSAGKTANDAKAVSVTASRGDVKGIITVEPVQAADFPADNSAKVTAAAPAWYQYKLTESGRYLFESTGEDTTTSFFYFDGTGRQYAANEAYLRSGIVVYAKVSTSYKEEKTAVLKTPEKINPETLEADKEVTVTPAEGKNTAYYVFTAGSNAEYTFDGADSIRYAVPQADGSDSISGMTVALEKDQKVFIRASKDAKLKVTKSAEVTKLEVGAESADITLEKGQKAIFAYNIFKNGRYAFETSTDKVTIGGIDGAYRTTIDRDAYKVCLYRGSVSGTFAVTNPTEETVTFKVSVTKVVPTELTEGEAKNVTKTDNADRYVFFSFQAPENDRYVFANTAQNAVDYRVISMGDYGVDGSLWANAQYIEKYSEEKDNACVLAVSAAENYDIRVSRLQPASVPLSEEGTDVAFKAADIKWIAFTAAEKAGTYSFTFTSETEPDNIYVYGKGLESYTGYAVLGAPVSYSINKGGSVYFMIDADADISLKVKAVLTSETAEFQAGSNGFDASEKEVKAYFTAPESGVYALRAALESGNYISVNTSLDGSGSNKWLYADQQISYALAAGESLYFTASLGNKGSIAIEKEASMRGLTQNTDTGMPAGINWFRFTAQEDGYYQFTFDKNVAAVKTYKNADVTDKGSPAQNLSGIGVEMTEGETLYLYIETVSAVNVRVEKEIEAEEVNLLSLWDYEWELSQGEVVILRVRYGYEDEYYTSRLYKIVASGSSAVKAEYRRKGMYNWVSMGSGTALETGTDWYDRGSYIDFRLTGLTDNTTVRLRADLLEIRLEMFYGSYYQEAYGSGQTTYTFTAPKDGQYSLGVYCEYADSEHPISVDYKDANGNIIESYTAEYKGDDDMWSIPNYYPQLYSGQTVKITVHYDNGEDGECYYVVNTSLSTSQTLTASQSVSGSAIAGERIKIAFIPDESGTYQFTVRNTSPYDEDDERWISAFISTGEDEYTDVWVYPEESDIMEVWLEADRTYMVYLNGGDGDSWYHAFSYELSVARADYIK
ncbi:MAG: hypothetical protein K2N73_07930 [Lachnospiraceae bacterium]|nr:hypothetical protein [Lachnospiraceae bacterium]